MLFRSEDVCIASIALWNAGRQFIDSSDFISPVNIQTSKPIIFLYAEQQRASRSSLNMKIPGQSAAGGGNSTTQNVLFFPPIGEAFERNDGVVIKIVFSGPPDTRFSVQARIKGAPQGFKELDLQSLHPATRWLTGVFLAFFAVVAVMGFLEMLQSVKKQGVGWWLIKECMALLMVALLVVVLVYKLSSPTAPAWVGIRPVKQVSAQ